MAALGIQRKVLLPPVRLYPGLATFAVTLAAVILGTLTKGIPFLLFAVIITAPFALIVWYFLTQAMGHYVYRTYGRRARQTMIEFIESEPKYLDAVGIAAKSSKSAATGSGLALTATDVFVMDEGEVARIPLDLVRSWEWKIVNHAVYDSNNLSDGAAVMLRNRRSKANAQLESGFFVTVKDVDKSVWQFRSMDKPLLQRWDEIFRQTFETRARLTTTKN